VSVCVCVCLCLCVSAKDVAGALNCEHILRALAMDSVNRQRFRVHCVGTQAPPSAKFVGIRELHSLLERLAAHS